MKNNIKRRDFVSGCFKAGAACFLISGNNNMLAMNALQDIKPDPKNLEYCGYKCPSDCQLKKATLENNPELKKKAYIKIM